MPLELTDHPATPPTPSARAARHEPTGTTNALDAYQPFPHSPKRSSHHLRIPLMIIMTTSAHHDKRALLHTQGGRVSGNLCRRFVV
jgi:hypothetical protein